MDDTPAPAFPAPAFPEPAFSKPERRSTVLAIDGLVSSEDAEGMDEDELEELLEEFKDFLKVKYGKVAKAAGSGKGVAVSMRIDQDAAVCYAEFASEEVGLHPRDRG